MFLTFGPGVPGAPNPGEPGSPLDPENPGAPGNQTGQVGLVGRSFLSLQELLLQKRLAQSSFKISKPQKQRSIVLVLELYENEELTW